MLRMLDSALVIIASSSVLAAAVTVVWNSVAERRRAAYVMKRDACLAALAVIDGVWAHMDWRPVAPQIQPRPSIEEVRRCHSLLLVTCRDPNVAEMYLECLGTKPGLTMDRIADLRNAIRAECRLGRIAEPNRDNTWLVSVGRDENEAGRQD